jgi:putative hydroxymethylpyrimidine transport system substrate-binding protein
MGRIFLWEEIIMKKLMALLSAVLLALSVTACGGTANKSASASSSKTTANSKLEDFDLILDWYPNAVHSFIYDAIEKGYYADEGLKVNIKFPANNTDPLSLSAAGKADAGLYYQDDVIIARAAENIPVKAIGTVVQEPLDLIASIADKNIKSPKDLKDKTVGYTGIKFGEAVIESMLNSEGLKMDDIKLINVGFDLMSSMTTGNVDATFGCFINHEIPMLEKEGFKMNCMKLTDYGVPNYYSLVFVAGEKNLEKNPEKYEKFMRATKKGFEDMKNNPDGTLKILLKSQDKANYPLDPDVEKKSMSILLPMMEKENSPFLTQDPECYQENIDWLYKNGLIPKKVNPSDMYVDIK